jgi:hypothetical protein
VSDVRHFTPDAGWQPGPDPQRRDFQSFADPDGNTWILQESKHGQ